MKLITKINGFKAQFEACKLFTSDINPLLNSVHCENNRIWGSNYDNFLFITGNYDLENMAIPATTKLFEDDYSIEKQDKQALLVSGNKKLKINLIDDSLPLPEALLAEISTTEFIAEAKLVDQLARHAKYSSKYDTNNILGGVLLRFTEDKVSIAATNGNILGYQDFSIVVDGDSIQKEIVISRDNIALLAKLVKLLPALGTIKIQPLAKHVKISYLSENDTAVNLYLQLLDGHYPCYEQLVPREHTHELKLNYKELVSTCKELENYTNEITNMVCFKIRPDSINIEANHDGQSIDIQLENANNLTGFELDTYFSVALWREVLDCFKMDKPEYLIIKANGALQPWLVDCDSSKHHALIMPIRHTKK